MFVMEKLNIYIIKLTDTVMFTVYDRLTRLNNFSLRRQQLRAPYMLTVN